MSYNRQIEIFKIKTEEFISPLAESPSNESRKHLKDDLVFIIDNKVWIKDRESFIIPDSGKEITPKHEYVLAAYSPEFVRLNSSIFQEVI